MPPEDSNERRVQVLEATARIESVLHKLEVRLVRLEEKKKAEEKGGILAKLGPYVVPLILLAVAWGTLITKIDHLEESLVAVKKNANTGHPPHEAWIQKHEAESKTRFTTIEKWLNNLDHWHEVHEASGPHRGVPERLDALDESVKDLKESNRRQWEEIRKHSH